MSSGRAPLRAQRSASFAFRASPSADLLRSPSPPTRQGRLPTRRSPGSRCWVIVRRFRTNKMPTLCEVGKSDRRLTISVSSPIIKAAISTNGNRGNNKTRARFSAVCMSTLCTQCLSYNETEPYKAKHHCNLNCRHWSIALISIFGTLRSASRITPASSAVNWNARSERRSAVLNKCWESLTIFELFGKSRMRS